MSALDEIGRRVAQLQERLVSAVVFAVAAAAAALVVPPERRYMVCVCLGAAGWAMIECFRLHVAGDDERETLDRLILAGSCDPRCERRRAQLRSAAVQHNLARMLRQTCVRAHTGGAATDWLLDWRTVLAVEDDLRQLAAVFDRDAGSVPPEAVVRIRMLIGSPASPLCVARASADSRRGAIRSAQTMIARCRADLPD